MDLLHFPHKLIRAKAIDTYMRSYGYTKCVCFTCGNAGTALLEVGVDTLIVSEHQGTLAPKEWYSPGAIHAVWPHLFDATSGHLPIDLMLYIADRYKNYLGEWGSMPRNVPTGSGETVVCLSLAYPDIKFKAVYDNTQRATTYHPDAVLNELVLRVCGPENVIGRP